MIIPIDKEKKVILLGWLQQGYIDTLDLPEAYKDGSLFEELLKETSIEDDSENGILCVKKLNIRIL